MGSRGGMEKGLFSHWPLWPRMALSASVVTTGLSGLCHFTVARAKSLWPALADSGPGLIFGAGAKPRTKDNELSLEGRWPRWPRYPLSGGTLPAGGPDGQVWMVVAVLAVWVTLGFTP